MAVCDESPQNISQKKLDHERKTTDETHKNTVNAFREECEILFHKKWILTNGMWVQRNDCCPKWKIDMEEYNKIQKNHFPYHYSQCYDKKWDN